MISWIILQLPMYLGAVNCTEDQKKRFLGVFPTWYTYIKDYGASNGGCGFGDMPLQDYAIPVGLAAIDILLRAGALAAVAFIVMGGYRYISSQGEPKNIEAAMATIVNAAIGLGITVSATVLVAYIGNNLGG